MKKALGVSAGLIGGAGVLVAGLAPMAAATGASGVSGAFMARGAFVEPVDLTFRAPGTHGRDVIHVRDAADTIVQKIVVDGGGHTGWHTHHGPVVVVVQSGTVTLYDESCTARTYRAGETFLDAGDHAHIAKNKGDTTAELWATYFDVPSGQSPRIGAADHGECE